MSKSRTKKPIAEEAELDKPVKPYLVRTAKITDDFCDYSIEVMEGVGAGRIAGFGDKKHIIDDDLRNRFAELNTHLAASINIFKHAKVKANSFEDLVGHHLVSLFDVSGISIVGDDDNMAIFLNGTMYVDAVGGRFKLNTPKIPLDNTSSYKWYNELKEAILNVRKEVELYHEGKYTNVDTDDEDDETGSKFKQGSLYSQQNNSIGGEETDKF